jgi:hypothetical protein
VQHLLVPYKSLQQCCTLTSAALTSALQELATVLHTCAAHLLVPYPYTLNPKPLYLYTETFYYSKRALKKGLHQPVHFGET